MRGEEEARWLETVRFQMERMATRARLGMPVQDTAATNETEWTITALPLDFQQGAGDAAWQGWEISPSNRPSLKTVFYLRKP